MEPLSESVRTSPQIYMGKTLVTHATIRHTYLCVNRKRRLPVLRRNYSTNSVFLALWRNLPDIRLGIPELLLGGTEGRRFRDAMRTMALQGLPRSIGLTSAFDSGQVEGSGPARAQGYIVRVGRMRAG